MTVADEVLALAEQAVGRPVLAGAFFHVRAPGLLPGGWIGALLTLLGWLIERRVSGLPGTTYLAVTSSRVVALEFRFAPTKLRRVVRTWERSSLRATTTGLRAFNVNVHADGRLYELEATTFDARSRAVIELLVGE